ncbi:enamine deaminase RidA (YjgF/YER057c/UK114 family) [Amorphus suaedae]
MLDILRKGAGPYRSAAVAAGGLVYVSGQVADCESPDVATQTQEVLDKLDRILVEMGSDRSRIVFAQVWLADIADYDAMNRIWDAWVVPDQAPARAAVEARLPDPRYRIEIMVIATRNEGPQG